MLALARAHGVESDLLPKVATAFCSGIARMTATLCWVAISTPQKVRPRSAKTGWASAVPSIRARPLKLQPALFPKPMTKRSILRSGNYVFQFHLGR